MASLEVFARGQSPALGCALPQEDYAARSLMMGPVVPIKEFQAGGLKQHVNCLLGVLRAHCVLLPCERVLDFLTACQQQQRGLLPSYSSSSGTSHNLGGSSSSCSSSNDSSTNRHSNSGSRGNAGASNAAAAAPGGGGGGGRPLGAGGSSPVSALADAFSLSKQDIDDAVRVADHAKSPGVLWLMLQPPRRYCMTDSQEDANSSSKGQQQQQGNSQLLHATNSDNSSAAGKGAPFGTSTATEAFDRALAAAEGSCLWSHEPECATGRERVAVALEQLQLLLQLLFIAWPSTVEPGGEKAAAAAAAGEARGRAAGAAPGGARAATAGAVPGAGATSATAAAGTATAGSAEDKVGMAGTAGGRGGPRGVAAAACQEPTKELAILEYEHSCWGLLLLLAALLEQAPAEAKQQLMQQPEGTLLLQLLYRVLLDQDKMENEDRRDSAPLLLVDLPVVDVLSVLGGHSFPKDLSAAPPELFSVEQLVLMVLQGLLLVAPDLWVPEGKEEQLLKQTSGVLLGEGELQG